MADDQIFFASRNVMLTS